MNQETWALLQALRCCVILGKSPGTLVSIPTKWVHGTVHGFSEALRSSLRYLGSQEEVTHHCPHHSLPHPQPQGLIPLKQEQQFFYLL